MPRCKNCGRPLIRKVIPGRLPWTVKGYGWRHQITKIAGKKPKCKRAVPDYSR